MDRGVYVRVVSEVERARRERLGSMHLYGGRERLSLIFIPRPSPCKMHIEKG
jgi:hypothetical protein